MSVKQAVNLKTNQSASVIIEYTGCPQTDARNVYTAVGGRVPKSRWHVVQYARRALSDRITGVNLHYFLSFKYRA